MFIGSYRGCLETPKYNKSKKSKVVTYSVYKMDKVTTKASPIGKKYTNWDNAFDAAANLQKNNTDKGVYYFPDEN